MVDASLSHFSASGIESLHPYLHFIDTLLGLPRDLLKNSKRLYATLSGVVFAAAFACGGRSSAVQPSPLESTHLTSQAPTLSGDGDPGGRVGTLVGAGDIALCGSGGAGALSTARLLDQISGTVFTAGDNAYWSGTSKEYQNCYAPAWGRHRGRTRPSPGNHEYESGSASGYFDYYGESAGPAGLGYYTYTIGSWRVFSLNSEVPSGPGSAQGEWLRNELAGERPGCTLAYWHRPLFSSGKIGDNLDMRDLWRTLYAANVDVVINGHDHLYERFAPQDPDGRPDNTRGIREFIVGTGGAPISGIVTLHANSQVRGTSWGVAVFNLYDHGYEWRFVPSTDEFEDSGSSACH
jgi:hypothetical protein